MSPMLPAVWHVLHPACRLIGLTFSERGILLLGYVRMLERVRHNATYSIEILSFFPQAYTNLNKVSKVAFFLPFSNAVM